MCKIALHLLIAYANQRAMPNLLARFLDKHGLSQVEFSRMVHCSPVMVSLWTSGKRKPGLAYALVIEKVTNGAIPAFTWVRNGR